MKLIYIASPYSHIDPIVQLKREIDINKIAARLQVKYGYAFFLPITQSAQLCRYNKTLGGSFKKWAKVDLFLIGNKCDEVWVVMLHGWDKSIGVTAEIKHALKHNIKVRYYDPKKFKFIDMRRYLWRKSLKN